MSLPTKLRKRIAFFGAIGLTAAMVVVAVPALAADDTGQTVVAQLGADGGVTSVMALGGAAKPASSALPITLKVSATQNANTIAADKVAGASGTIGLRYVVTNTTGKQQDINYTDPAGAPQTIKAELQVPYVAQLDVILPQGWTGVHATGASITSMPDGSMDVRWSMVLFSPIGSPTQSVALSATGSGKKSPTATLSARVVNPVNDSTLATSGVDANSTIAQNGLLGSYADGAKSGLDQLADGATQLMVGLQQLADGANDLHSGLVEGQDGTNKLAQGLHSTTGKPDLLGGSKALAAGVGAISDGLGKLSDTSTGLPAAKLGVTLLQQGVGQLLAGLGPISTSQNPAPFDPQHPTAQGAVSALSTGVTDLTTGVGAEKDGVNCVKKVIGDLINGAPPAAKDPCYASALPPDGGHPFAIPPVTDPIDLAVLKGIDAGIGTSSDQTDTTILGGLNLLLAGVGAVQAGLTGQGGLRDGLNLIIAGLTSPTCDAEFPKGNKDANPPTPPCGVEQGLEQLLAGLTVAVQGANDLFLGSKDAKTGAGQLASGVGDESLGMDQLAAGLPAATDGSKQIADGLGQALTGSQQIATGQTQVRDQAVVPLATQLSQGGGNAAGTVAVLAALSTSASKPPLGTGTTLILTQADVNPGPTWPLWLAIAVAAAAIIVGLIVGLLIGPRRRRHAA